MSNKAKEVVNEVVTSIMAWFVAKFTTNPYATSYAKAPADKLAEAKKLAEANKALKVGNKAVIPGEAKFKFYTNSTTMLDAITKSVAERDTLYKQAFANANDTAKGIGAKKQRETLGLLAESIANLNLLATKALLAGNAKEAMKFALQAKNAQERKDANK